MTQEHISRPKGRPIWAPGHNGGNGSKEEQCT